MDQGFEGPTDYIHITQNEFLRRRHMKQKEEDIAICNCKYNTSFPDTACGDRCLNALTNTECTPGYCPSGGYCKNQKFQRCEYVKTRLFKTAGRGWGLLADQNIKAGQFIIEYCGEVISWKEAKKRAQAYEELGITDAYMIALNADESIDATKKGSLARFINHSCEPNCETRKWTVLGEVRVGIFAKQDIFIGTELAYDYNFEWYGGAKIRCLCGAVNCSGFLGAKSRGFQVKVTCTVDFGQFAVPDFLGRTQVFNPVVTDLPSNLSKEDTYLWEDDDDRFSVEKIPLYDSAEDEPSIHLSASTEAAKSELSSDVKNGHFIIKGSYSEDSQHPFAGKSTAPISQTSHSLKKKVKPLVKKRAKTVNPKEIDAKSIARLLVEKEAQEEILTCEEIRAGASSDLESLYNEIRPAIEEHERDTQDSVPTSVAEKWIKASCDKWKSEFDLYSSIIKNVAFTPQKKRSDISYPGENAPPENEVMLLTNGRS